MKHTLEGFSQPELIKLGLDNTDALLLRWFVDFKDTGRMKPMTIGETVYHWVQYQAVIEDLPCIGIENKEAMGRRFRKLVEAKVLKLHVHSVGGRFTYFAIDPTGYAGLVYQPTQKSEATDSKVVCQPTQKSGQIDSSTNDSSTRSKYTQDSPPLVLATLLMTLHRKHDPKFLVGKESATLQRWADDVEKLIRIDQRIPGEIRRVIEWCQGKDCWWKSNILSGATLRRQFPTLFSQMQSSRVKAPLEGQALIDRIEEINREFGVI